MEERKFTKLKEKKGSNRMEPKQLSSDYINYNKKKYLNVSKKKKKNFSVESKVIHSPQDYLNININRYINVSTNSNKVENATVGLMVIHSPDERDLSTRRCLGSIPGRGVSTFSILNNGGS